MVILLTGVITFFFWKKPKLLPVLPFIPFLITLIVNPKPPPFVPPCIPHPIDQIFVVITVLTIISICVSALLFILGGVFIWIKFKNDKNKLGEARKHILTGVITLVLTIILTIVIANILISAIVAAPTTLCIPTLKEFN